MRFIIVGLSDIAHITKSQFLILERDDQAGPDAAIKRVYFVDLGDLSAVDGINLKKSLVTDLVPYLAATGGVVPEKVESLTIDDDGNIWIVNDNDGLEDNSGEQQLLKIDATVLLAH